MLRWLQMREKEKLLEVRIFGGGRGKDADPDEVPEVVPFDEVPDPIIVGPNGVFVFEVDDPVRVRSVGEDLEVAVGRNAYLIKGGRRERGPLRVKRGKSVNVRPSHTPRRRSPIPDSRFTHLPS